MYTNPLPTLFPPSSHRPPHPLPTHPTPNRIAVEELCSAAVQEDALHTKFRAVVAEWGSATLTFTEYANKGPVALKVSWLVPVGGVGDILWVGGLVGGCQWLCIPLVFHHHCPPLSSNPLSYSSPQPPLFSNLLSFPTLPTPSHIPSLFQPPLTSPLFSNPLSFHLPSHSTPPLQASDTADLIERLEEAQMLLASMVTNRYAAPFREELTSWLGKLSTVDEQLELWLSVQVCV